MKRILRHSGWILAVAIIFSGAAYAQEPVEAGDWINLFDGHTLFGWTCQGDSTCRVEDGAIIIDGGAGGSLATTSQFEDFEFQAEVKLPPGGSATVFVRNGGDGEPLNSGGVPFTIKGAEAAEGTWQDLKIVAKGDRVAFSIEGSSAEEQNIQSTVGHISFVYLPDLQNRMEIRNVRLRPLNMVKIFNEKDLTGWNVLPGHNSEFSVAEGELQIKDGNGQIETEGEYKNFLLQLDVFVAGERLNSGVFVRGPKGVFWKGYESQIRNEWEGADRTKPVDFGTGGIYGIQPAREVVSSDREWFTKTIVMNGNHMAVWVNGKQVSDFTDTRPVDEKGDGKRGYVPGPGTIHLQGHDPTTDLRFRDIHIQEYADQS